MEGEPRPSSNHDEEPTGNTVRLSHNALNTGAAVIARALDNLDRLLDEAVARAEMTEEQAEQAYAENATHLAGILAKYEAGPVALEPDPEVNPRTEALETAIGSVAVVDRALRRAVAYGELTENEAAEERTLQVTWINEITDQMLDDIE